MAQVTYRWHWRPEEATFSIDLHMKKLCCRLCFCWGETFPQRMGVSVGCITFAFFFFFLVLYGSRKCVGLADVCARTEIKVSEFAERRCLRNWNPAAYLGPREKCVEPYFSPFRFLRNGSVLQYADGFTPFRFMIKSLHKNIYYFVVIKIKLPISFSPPT